MLRLIAIGMLACLALVPGGCGPEKPKMVTLSGKVVRNGKPVTAGSIYFYPEASNAYQKDNPSSLLQTDGSFKAKTFPFGEGIPPGTYKVTLEPGLATRLNAPDYSDPQKTPWKIEVPDAGVTDKVFEVKAVEAPAEGQ